MAARLAIIGAGSMGAAIVRGAIGAHVLHGSDVLVVEIDHAKRAAMEELGCAVSGNLRDATDCEHVLLAIKPQSFPAMASEIVPLERSTIVISIMAGLGSESIRRSLGEQARVVRCMPNTPCRIGRGMTAIALGAGARHGDEQFALSLFNSIGRTLIVNESQMHAVTAVSGSGPAYVFLLAEAMQQAAMELGLPPEGARTLVTQTVLGAACLLNEPGQDAKSLREAVTSPGGTTARALRVMFERNLPETIMQAITAARDRGRELDKA